MQLTMCSRSEEAAQDGIFQVAVDEPEDLSQMPHSQAGLPNSQASQKGPVAAQENAGLEQAARICIDYVAPGDKLLRP